MSRAILKTFLMVSLRKTGPERRLRILLTLETSSPTRCAISTCVTIHALRCIPALQCLYKPDRKIGSSPGEVKEFMGKFTHRSWAGRDEKKDSILFAPGGHFYCNQSTFRRLAAA